MEKEQQQQQQTCRYTRGLHGKNVCNLPYILDDACSEIFVALVSIYVVYREALR